jgi:16S rRNA (adenine1518-N6/adenine1519-N6)-dimethyltransferase
MKRRSLGQHYLIDSSVVRRLVSLAGLTGHERVLEIGTGRGALTKELAKEALRLEGYEVDEENLRATRINVGNKKLKLHLADAFRERPRFDVLVASLPYSRSSTFVEWISQLRYDRAVVLLQEDFVKKVMARPGHRDYRAVSVIAQASCEIREVGRVPRSSFSPQPKVNSVLVTLKPKRRLTLQEMGAVKRLFALRRRQVGAALTKLGGTSPEGLSKRRVFTLSPDQALDLAANIEG